MYGAPSPVMTMPMVLRDPRTAHANELMLRFAERTGLSGRRAPRRYLWTDAFAVCNFLGLARATGKERYRELAGELVDQVHHVLGRFAADDPRTGWISGFDDAAGELHPTLGGLRIGKPQLERRAGEPFVERREWDRDGQYFHYLTKWMVALESLARDTSREQPLIWARELAHTAYHAFTTGHRDSRRMVWKMSVDLSRPLVDSMGQHDPLDGLVTCLELDAAAHTLGTPQVPSLDAAICEYTALVDRHSLTTADPLGLGGLLLDAWRLARLPNAPSGMLHALLEATATGLEFYAGLHDVAQPAARRLAFRELGLAIGLAAYAKIPVAARPSEAAAACARIERHAGMREHIEEFWLHGEHRALPSWTEHADINDVMLATCLCPDGFLER
jgi:hypothetical protein